MKQKLRLMVAFLSILVFSCRKDLPYSEQEQPLPLEAAKTNLPVGNGMVKIAVVSDIHYMDPSLLVGDAANGEAFQNYLDQDPKLVQYSAAIFQSVFSDLKNQRPAILLVPGDMTKDGEPVSHRAVAGYLSQLRDMGTKVYVLPGNHDINNAKAVKYVGDAAIPLERTTPEEFARIYKNFGYHDFSGRDKASLSYVEKPYKDLWILAIDASRYEEYGPSGDIADGRIKPETMSWITKQLEDAKKHGAYVIAMMHHNLVEHYAGQSQLDPGYVVDGWQNLANLLAGAGVEIIFTGHYHGHDITAYTYNGHKLYDIETGSLVTTPSPYRLITLKNKNLNISTSTVQTINESLPGGLSFPVYSNQFLYNHLIGYFGYLLTNKFGVPQPLADFASPLFTNGIMAHFAGDENMPADQAQLISQLAQFLPELAGMVTTLWTDLGEADNNNTITIDK